MKYTNPFPGLRPFEGKESHLFFGRERHVDEINRKLETYRFVSIVGNSGSGKSSLIRAGLLPYLKEQGKGYQIIKMRPGDNPIDSLKASLRSSGIVENIEGELEDHALGLVQLVRSKVNEHKPLLLLVDQFEELFRFNSIYNNKKQYQRVAHFIDILLASVDQRDVPISVIITLRSDFLGDCEQFMGLPEAINDGQFLVPRMNRDELESTIVKPILYAKAKISPRLVQTLANAVGSSPDQLPVLQHVLMRTFNVWMNNNEPEQPIDLVHYEATGGIDNALSRHAEKAFALLNKQQRNIAAKIFKTVTSKEADNRGVRRPTALSVICEIIQEPESTVIDVVNVFRSADKGFLTPQDSSHLDSNSVVDISHESLMRKWDQLKLWVEEEANSAELYKRICENALLYEQDKASLWRDPDLQIAKDWIKEQTPNQAWAAQYDSHFNNAIRFIEASAQQKSFLIREKNRNRKIRNTAVVVILILLSLLSVWAVSERNSATASAQIAEEKRLEADTERERAEVNLNKAKKEEQRANEQNLEAQKQRQLADANAQEATEASMLAQQEAERSRVAEIAAERERLAAIVQTQISDSLRTIAEIANEESQRLRLLGISKNLAIRSKLMSSESNKTLKALLALQAYRFNADNNGEHWDSEIFEAVYSAYRAYQNESEYLFRGHRDAVQAIAYTKDQSLLSAGSDGQIIMTSSTGNTIGKYSNSTYPIDQLVSSKITDQIAVSNSAYEILLFKTSNLSEPEKVIKTGHAGKIVKMIWHNSGIFSLSRDSSLRLFDLKTGELVTQKQLAFSPVSATQLNNSSRLFIGDANGNIYLMDIVSGSIGLFAATGKAGISSLAYDTSKGLLAYGTSSGFCELLDKKGKPLGHLLSGHEAGVVSIQFNPTGEYVATASWDSKVRLYAVDQPNQAAVRFEDHSSWVLDLCFNSNGKVLASASKDKTVRTYPVNQNAMVEELVKLAGRNLSKEEWNLYVGSDIPYKW